MVRLTEHQRVEIVLSIERGYESMREMEVKLGMEFDIGMKNAYMLGWLAGELGISVDEIP